MSLAPSVPKLEAIEMVVLVNKWKLYVIIFILTNLSGEDEKKARVGELFPFSFKTRLVRSHNSL